MKYIKQISFLLFYIFCIQINAAEQSKELLVKEVIVKTNLKPQLSFVNDSIHQAFEQLMQMEYRLSDEQKDNLKKELQAYFNTEIFLNKIKLKLHNELSSNELKSIIKQHNTELFKKFSKEENLAMRDDFVFEMQKFMIELKKQMPDKIRVDLIDEIDIITDSSEMSKTVSINIFAGILKRLNHIQNNMSDLQLMQVINSLNTAFDEESKENSIATLLFIYKNINNSELNKYIKETKSNTANRKFFNVVNSTLTSTLESFSSGKEISNT